jgi:hypothetical protein
MLFSLVSHRLLMWFQTILLVWRPLRHAASHPSRHHGLRATASATCRTPAPPASRRSAQPQQAIRWLQRIRRNEHTTIQLLAMAVPPPLLANASLLHNPPTAHWIPKRYIHSTPRLRGAKRRSHPAAAANLGELEDAQLQRLPAQRARQLDRG